MSLLTEIATGAGATIIAIIIIAKFTDVFKNKKVYLSVLETIKSKGVLSTTKAYIKATEAILDSVIPGNTIYKQFVIALNSSLMLSIVNIAESIVESNAEERKSKTIVGLMLGEKLKKSANSQLFLITALLINIILSLLSDVPINTLVIVVAIGLLAIHIDHKLIEHRLKNGWYGKNEFETREIIEFIVSHANKDDFNDKGGLKKVIPLPELNSTKEHASNLGGATV